MALPALDPLEVYSGLITGLRRTPLPAADDAPPAPTPVAALDALLLDALSRPPCHVLFSGGRDSAVVLAAAVGVARRHGLEPPIALTGVHPDLPEADEEAWQRVVIDHLGVRDWERVPFRDEFDLLGPDARGALRRHGLYWPPAALSMLVLGRLAGTGTVVTGGGGDEVFSPWAWQRVPLREILKLRPVSRAAKWAAFYRLPLRVRQRHLGGREHEALPWLRPDARDAVNAALNVDEAPRPTAADDLERFVRSRYRELLRATMDAFAADAGVGLVEPFYDARFIRALARASPRTGWVSRSGALEATFDGLLPQAVTRRTTKAYFTRASWGAEARAFAERWDGSGVDTGIVDPERLRTEWARPAPDARSVGGLHQAWLATSPD